jgi:hypothetical protein
MAVEFSEMQSLYERSDWLVIQTNDRQRKVAIPKEVDGYEALHTELAKHAPLTAPPRRSSSGWAVMLTSIVAWWLLLWSANDAVVRVAGAPVLLLLAWSSFYLYRLRLSGAKRLPLWFLLGVGWAAALVLVYIRTLNGLAGVFSSH